MYSCIGWRNAGGNSCIRPLRRPRLRRKVQNRAKGDGAPDRNCMMNFLQRKRKDLLADVSERSSDRWQSYMQQLREKSEQFCLS